MAIAQLRQVPAPTLRNEQVGGLIVHKLNCLNVAETPAQCRRKISMIAITPKYPNFCRTSKCCSISVTLKLLPTIIFASRQEAFLKA